MLCRHSNALAQSHEPGEGSLERRTALNSLSPSTNPTLQEHHTPRATKQGDRLLVRFNQNACPPIPFPTEYLAPSTRPTLRALRTGSQALCQQGDRLLVRFNQNACPPISIPSESLSLSVKFMGLSDAKPKARGLMKAPPTHHHRSNLFTLNLMGSKNCLGGKFLKRSVTKPTVPPWIGM